ncbi:hypothetical protein QUB60_20050 [Microcoleus sp. A2-C5]
MRVKNLCCYAAGCVGKADRYSSRKWRSSLLLLNLESAFQNWLFERYLLRRAEIPGLDLVRLRPIAMSELKQQ